MTNRPVVLVTGLGGLIGSAVRKHLADRYELRGLGRRPGPAGVPWTAADIADFDSMRAAFAGVDAVKKEDRPTVPRDFSVWCSQRDIALMIGACLDAPPDLRFDVFYVTSRNGRGYRDLEPARKVLGWKPFDSADTAR